MKTVKVEVSVFEVGDYVRTPAGVGIIIEEFYDHREYEGQEITVQHKSGLNGNPENKPKELNSNMASLIYKSEYNKEVWLK